MFGVLRRRKVLPQSAEPAVKLVVRLPSTYYSIGGRRLTEDEAAGVESYVRTYLTDDEQPYVTFKYGTWRSGGIRAEVRLLPGVDLLGKVSKYAAVAEKMVRKHKKL